MKPCRVRRRRIAFVAAGLWLAGCGREHTGASAQQTRVDPPAISSVLQAQLETWFAQHGQPPGDYVLGLFASRDVVLLGEQHRILHDLQLVHALLPRLPAAGVHVVALEFARRADQPLLDSLLAAPEWHEDLAREIIFRQFVAWGFQEYVDMLAVTWRVNRQRPPGTPPLRVLGLNHSFDYSQFRTEADWQNDEVWKRVLGSQVEADWAAPVLAAVASGEKVLAFCGIHHVFTKFRQPRVAQGTFAGRGDLRFGNALYEKLGERVASVYLHAPWNGVGGYDAPYVHPADGRLDAFMLARPAGPFAVGFDVAPSPLGSLPIQNAVYKHGSESFTMAQFCDGWIYTKPIGQFVPVTFIEGWIHAGNLERARANAMNPAWRAFSVQQLNEGCRSYQEDFQRFYGALR